jgi:DNA-binding NarL/FixJ family response regulator
MEEQPRILIVAKQTLLREGLRAMLSAGTGFKVVAEAQDGPEGVRCAEKFEPDLILLDLSISHSFDTLKTISRRLPGTRVLSLTGLGPEGTVSTEVGLNVDGHIRKEAGRSVLLMKMKELLRNGRRISYPRKVLGGFARSMPSAGDESARKTLTKRELQTLKLIAQGYKNREVAGCLRISPRTVEKHRASIMKKLGLQNSASLTAYAIRSGLVSERSIEERSYG